MVHGNRRLTLALACLAAGSVLHAARPAQAQLAPGFVTTQQSHDFGSNVNIGAVTFATNGANANTLYAVPSPFVTSGGQLTTVNSIDAISPSGGVTSIPLVNSGSQPVQLFGVGGATWDPYTQSLLVADNQFGSFSPTGQDVGALYSIAVSGPQAGTVTTLFTYQGDGNLAQVAVRGGAVGSTGAGQIFVADANFNTSNGTTHGAVFSVSATPNQAFDIAGTNPNFVVPRSEGLTYTAGIGFTATNHLVVQQLDSNFVGHVYQTTLTDGVNGPTAGVLSELPASLALGSVGGPFSFGLAVVNQNDLYLTGSNNTDGGVSKIDTTSSSSTSVDSLVFGAGLSFLAGSHNFAPFAGANAGLLAFIPDTFSGPDGNVVVITPLGASVPEPSTLVLAIVAGLGSLAAVWRSKRRAIG